jgi:hypothetical protein
MRLVVVLALACFAAACADDDPPPDDTVDCAAVTDADEFVIGLQKQGARGALTFTIMSGDPAPPVRGDNTWVIELTASSTPVAGAFVSVVPFMPAHGHGAGKFVEVTESTQELGQYELSPVNLWMPGVWETTIAVTSASGDDDVVFRFCIPS